MPVGVTSEQTYFAFKKTLWPPKAYGKFEISWPTEITGLRVEAVDTVAGQSATARKHGLGQAGLWLRVRVAGLGDLKLAAPDRALGASNYER